MKEVYDLKLSKRAQMVPDEQDLINMNKQIAEIGKAIFMMEDLEKLLALSDERQAVVELSRVRVKELQVKALERPLTQETIVWHGQMQGRIAERLRMTEELAGVRLFKEDVLPKKRTKILDQIKFWKKKNKKGHK